MNILNTWLLLTLVIPYITCQQITSDEDIDKVPSTLLDLDNGAKIFSGRSVDEHFNGQVLISDNYILVGSRDILFNISLSVLKEFNRYEWPSSDDVIEFCKNRDVPKDKCHNYIKVMLENNKSSSSPSSSSSSSSSKEFFICGTNSFKPTCRTLAQDQVSGSYKFMDEVDGRAISPADPDFNNTAIYYENKLFSATVFSRDSLILSSPIRTQLQNSLLLNDPNFVGSISHDGLIYFFFRETAIENINCGKVIFSRVARVCPSDKGGGGWIMKNLWTTYFKARLNCSLPGEYPFYFDEIQSISEPGDGNIHSTPKNVSTRIIYAVFNTPRNSLRGSAVCAFEMSDVLKSFRGKFKDRQNDYSNWLPSTNAPEPHPAATCPNDTLALSDQTLNFIKSHPLMDAAVPASGGRPAFVQSSFKYSLTQVAVDWHMLAADRHYYDIIFTGTDDGRILKTFNGGKGHEVSPRIIEVLLTSTHSPILGLKIFTNPSDDQQNLLIVTKDRVISAPLHRCGAAKSCRSCVSLKDPYCSWTSNACVYSQHGLQSLETGRHSKCPIEADAIESKPSCQLCKCIVPHKIEALDKTTIQGFPGTTATTPFFSVTTNPTDLESAATFDLLVYPGTCISSGDDCSSSLKSQVALAVILSIIISLTVGFVMGVCFTQRRKVYAYGITRINSLRNQVSKSKDYGSDSQTKSENYYETGPPSSASSHRPIVPSQYWIKNKSFPRDDTDVMQRLPSDSSSFTFASPAFSPNGEPPTPPSINKLPLKLNIFNFLKDGTPSRIIPRNITTVLDENVELSKAEADATFPFIDGISENAVSTFHNSFDITPTTPVIVGEVGNTNDVGNKMNFKPTKSFVRKLRSNNFVSNSISKVRSFLLGSEPEVHL